jgi:dTDP-4-dehydrorhamnose reductase
MSGSRVLVIGGDSQIGRRLGEILVDAGVTAFQTTRRSLVHTSSSYFFDLGRTAVVDADLPVAKTVVLCAGISGYAACAKDPVLAAKVNFTDTVSLASRFLRDGSHVIFLSSTASLGDAPEMSGEEARCSPVTVYGVLKRAVELALEEAARQYGATLSIVRLTKVVSSDTPFVKGWLAAAKAGKVIDAFSNCKLSPVSLDYVCKGLLKIIDEESGGLFHFSGVQAYTYLEFAASMAKTGLLPDRLIRTAVSSNTDDWMGYLDPAALGMERTEAVLSISAEPVVDVLAYLSTSLSVH